MLNDYHNNGTNYSWISTIKTTLDNLGMSNIWISHNFLSVNSLWKQVEQRQYDQYLEILKNTISLSSRGKTYQVHKERLTLENYINILPETLWIISLKFKRLTIIFLTKLVVGMISLQKTEFVHYVKMTLEMKFIIC